MADSSRFSAQSATAEDLLKSQTVGLVNLADFRKRRAEALQVKERESASGASSGTATPADDRALTPGPARKKKKKTTRKGGLSFADGDIDADNDSSDPKPHLEPQAESDTSFKASSTSLRLDEALGASSSEFHGNATPFKPKLKPNANIAHNHRILSKAAQQKDAALREQLRREFLLLQTAVKATEIAVPFVFYDGTNIPGGIVRVKKGEHIWLFLDKARKVGAESGAGGGEKGRREWARVGVDDLMFVRGDIIVPHHYEFYYFIVNRTQGFKGTLFDYAAEPTACTPKHLLTGRNEAREKTFEPLSRGSRDGGSGKAAPQQPEPASSLVEGLHDNPSVTRVVDRRWYMKNKHIYPASTWEEFDPTKDYTKGIKKDTSGNTFFFS